MSCISGPHVGGVISWGRHDLFPAPHAAPSLELLRNV